MNAERRARTLLVSAPITDDSRVLSEALSELEGSVVAARDRAEMFDLAEDCSLTLILVDLDGDPAWPSTLRTLHTRAPNVPLVAHSRLMGPSLWIDALEAGAFDVICRPFLLPELRAVFQNAWVTCNSR